MIYLYYLSLLNFH